MIFAIYKFLRNKVMSCWIKIFSRLHNIKLTAIATHLQAFRLDQLKNYFCHRYILRTKVFWLLFLYFLKQQALKFENLYRKTCKYVFQIQIIICFLPSFGKEGHIKKLNCKLFYGVLQFTCFGFMIAQANIYWESFLRKKTVNYLWKHIQDAF